MVGGQQTSPDMAAFANGVMTRYLDYNDYCYTHGRGHPSDTIAPVLAAVEAARGDGKSVILGTVMAYDLLLGLSDSAAHVSRRLGRRELPGDRRGGGGLASFSLTRAQMRQAIGMAVSSHISLNRSRGGQISNWKAATSANDSRNGVFCALAARQGMTGPVDVFAGKGGFFQNTGSQFALLPLGGQHGTPFRIMGAEIRASRRAIQPHGHRGGARAAPQITAADIKAIRLFTGPSGMGYASERLLAPETRERADHSHRLSAGPGVDRGRRGGPSLRGRVLHASGDRGTDAEGAGAGGNEPEHQQAGPGMPTAVVEVDLHSGARLRMKQGFNARAAYLRTDQGQDEKQPHGRGSTPRRRRTRCSRVAHLGPAAGHPRRPGADHRAPGQAIGHVWSRRGPSPQAGDHGGGCIRSRSRHKMHVPHGLDLGRWHQGHRRCRLEHGPQRASAVKWAKHQRAGQFTCTHCSPWPSWRPER